MAQAARWLGESDVVLLECSVHNGRPHLEHEVCSSRWPAHLLFGHHPAMQKPMNRALGLRRRGWLAGTPCGGIIDNRIELSGDICIESPQNAGELFDVDRGQPDLACRMLMMDWCAGGPGKRRKSSWMR